MPRVKIHTEKKKFGRFVGKPKPTKIVWKKKKKKKKKRGRKKEWGKRGGYDEEKYRINTSYTHREPDHALEIDDQNSIGQSLEVRWVTERGAIISADVLLWRTLVAWMDHPTNESISQSQMQMHRFVKYPLEMKMSTIVDRSLKELNDDVFQILWGKFQLASSNAETPRRDKLNDIFSSSFNRDVNDRALGSNMASHTMLPSLSSRASHCALKPILLRVPLTALFVSGLLERRRNCRLVASLPRFHLDMRADTDKSSDRTSRTSVSAESSTLAVHELCERFPETPLCVALHPSGHILSSGSTINSACSIFTATLSKKLANFL